MNNSLPPIPAKRYFTIGEVAELCDVKPHVLRYWEQEFTQLRPMKRRGNRRYYQHHEVLMIRRIRELLYGQGFTISGARTRLQEWSVEQPLEAHAEQGSRAQTSASSHASHTDHAHHADRTPVDAAQPKAALAQDPQQGLPFEIEGESGSGRGTLDLLGVRLELLKIRAILSGEAV